MEREEDGAIPPPVPVIPAPIYQVIEEFLAFTARVDEAWAGERWVQPPAEASTEEQ